MSKLEDAAALIADKVIKDDPCWTERKLHSPEWQTAQYAAELAIEYALANLPRCASCKYWHRIADETNGDCSQMTGNSDFDFGCILHSDLEEK